MNLYDSASLLVTPNGYKTSKLYSVIPSDGLGDMTFTRAGDTATRVNSSGLIETVLANKPRLDYTGSTCPKLLLEPQRTNTFLRSNEFENSQWTKFNASITANTLLSPDGNQNADTFTSTSTLSNLQYFLSPLTNGQTYTTSVYVKAGTRSFCSLGLFGLADAYFNLTTLTYTFTGTGAVSASITDVGNGWRRVTATWTWGTGTTYRAFIVIASSLTSSTITSGDYIYIYGAQLEAGAYPTSYIPTTTATVTRNADAASKSGISSLLNSQAGTLVAFISPLKGNVGDLGGLKIDDSANAGNYVTIQFRNSPDNYIAGSYRLNGTGVSFTQAINPNINAMTKVVYTYQNGSQKLFINGSLVSSTTAVISNSVVFDRVTSSAGGTGVGAFYGNVHALSVFKTAISDADAITLTTL